ncbi:hypothetical protein ATANTOWER_005610, partial [Ataeniobius toweri]|nr:hypothetical protein [Ataeniobius toweri]
MYNSFTPGKENASQGENGLFSGQMERNHWRKTPNLGHESSFSFPETSPGAHETSKERDVGQYSLPDSNRPENHVTTLDSKSHSTFNIPPREEIGHQHSSTISGSSSFKWLPDHKRTPQDFSKSTSNVFGSGTPVEDRRLSSEPNYFRYNSQLAENILKNYGLERADMDELLSYPEEQTTAEKLPYLLQNIRMKKAMRAASAFQSNSSSTSQPTASASGIDAGVGFGQEGVLQDKMSSTLELIKVTKAEHTAACSAGADPMIGRNIQSTALSCKNNFLTASFQNSNQSKDGLLESFSKIKSGGLGSSDDQMGSFKVKSPPRLDYTRQLQTQPNQTHTSGMTRSTGFGQRGMPRYQKPKIIIQPIKMIGYAHTVKCVADVDESVKNICNTVTMGGQTLLMDGFQSSTQSKEASELSLVEIKSTSLVPSDQIVSVGGLNSPRNALPPPSSNPTDKLETQQNQALQSVSSLPLQHKNRDATSSGETETGPSQDLPSLAMMHDYAAVMPRTFSHTCSLCKKECAQLKDWVFHQNTTLHHANCKRLRSRYPHWDGVVPSSQRSRSCSPYYDRSALSCYRARSGSSEKLSSPKRMCKKSRNHEQQLSRGRSPERRLAPRSDRKQWSPKKSLERESSRKKTDGKQWSPKRSLERESSPRKTDDKQLSPIRIRICQSSPRMIDDKRCSSMSGWKKQMSPRRTHDRQWSPKRSLERQSSPRKTDDDQLSPIRIHIRQLSPRMIDDQRWSPTTGWKKQMSSRRTDDKRWSPTRSHERLSSPIRSHNKRYSPTRNHEQHSSPRGTDGKSWSPMRVRVRQSSPKNTDDKWWTLPRRTDERRRSPTRSRRRQSSPRKNGDKGWSPTTKCEQQLPPKDANLKQWSPTKTYEQRSSPKNTDDKKWSLLRRTDEKLWSPMRSHENHSSPGRTNDKQGSPAQSSEYRRRPGDKPWLPDKSHRQQSFPGRDEEHFVPMQSDEEMSSLRRKRKRHTSLEELSSQKKKSCSIQMLTKRLLKKSAVQSASRQSNIANVVNLVVPVLLSELAKTQESSTSLVLPSQAKNQKVLNLSSRGSKSCSSSQSNLPKLEWNPARSSKKLKDNTSKRALSIITEDWRKRHRVKARDGNEL